MTVALTGDAVSRYTASTSQIEAAAASMSVLYRNEMTVDAAPPARFEYEASAVSDGVLDLARLRFLGSVRAGATAFESFVVAYPVEGRHSWKAGRESGSGSVPFFLPPGRDLTADFDRLDLLTVSVTPEAFHRAMDSMGRSSRELMLARPNSMRRSPRLMAATMRFVDVALRQDPTAFASPLVRAEALRQIVVAITETYGVSAEEPQDPTVVHPRAVRRALAFMDSSAHLPVTVADVALESGLSLRGLQSAFRKQMGMSPSEYLRHVRLHGARDELLQAGDGNALTVESIALRWGFAHAGRFAAHYRSTFGEKPSETLRR
ncbi:helix-turn-helix domain-containing protein [Herbiconiux sp. SYSU D00978]|uniref:helix-turn-helix domain-containing protein n=1 Tax=Herbiconiux sp. SYSU D00978 TaxID=2812562 RepID=UPI001A960CDF|nr:helix-turn-helix domain-containing protein [Herbiconiux sp. SYSU D00978]